MGMHQTLFDVSDLTVTEAHDNQIALKLKFSGGTDIVRNNVRTPDGAMEFRLSLHGLPREQRELLVATLGSPSLLAQLRATPDVCEADKWPKPEPMYPLIPESDEEPWDYDPTTHREAI